MSIEQRYEFKFVFPPSVFHLGSALIQIQNECFKPSYPNRQVNNIYFDTFEYDSVGSVFSGVAERDKLRVRWYGELNEPAASKIELKTKSGLSMKKEVYDAGKICIASNPSFIKFKTKLSHQLPANAKLWLQNFPQPTLVNSYIRSYYQSHDSKVRITVDTKLKYWDLKLINKIALTNPIVTPELIVVELKCPIDQLSRAHKIMQSLPVRWSSHSKYVTAYEASMI